MTTRKLPIGIQDFECIRTDGYVYVDKTAYVYRLASEGKPYFLGRPRRFGKSLLLSTLKYYFEGRRELFDGLAMAELEKEWARHPVFHIDMNVGQYDSLDELKASLASRLRVLEDEWEVEAPDKLLSSRFENLIRGVAEKAGRRVVVLIDEYDKPLLKNLDDGPIQKSFLDVLKGFYGVLKSADQWLRFVFITGVTKFSHVSIFSDLNQLRDISMDKAFAGVCGISEAELAGSFAPEIRGLADDAAMTAEEARAEMRKRYDGYRFAPEAETVYNPFSVLNTFADRRFGYYWFRTGTPTFLVEQLRDTRFHVPDFTGGVSVYAQRIDDYRAKGDDPVPLLYQTGYLTIKDYEPRTGRYTLGFPNEEVKYAFLGELLDSYVPKGSNLKRLFAGDFAEDLRKGDVEAFMGRLRSLVASIPYDNKAEETEHYFQTVVYLVFTLLGQFVQAEVHGHKGRADCVAVTDGAVYVFEFKVAGGDAGKAAASAMRQMEEKDYAGPYRSSGKRLFRIAAVYDASRREMAEPDIREE